MLKSQLSAATHHGFVWCARGFEKEAGPILADRGGATYVRREIYCAGIWRTEPRMAWPRY